MSFSRNFTAPSTNRDPTFPRFHMAAVEDPIASAKAGRPIFNQQERVQIIQPMNPNSPVLIVTDEHRQRWQQEYEAFRKGEDVTVSGTPLAQWPLLNQSHVLELKAINIHTVEQCAGLDDRACQRIGMGGRALRENAKAYLDDADATRIVSAAIAEREKSEAAVANLQAQLDELRPLLDKLHSENMALKNAPNPVASVIPGMLDQVTAAGMHAPQEMSMPSALEGMQTRRRRGAGAEAA